eukprot:TRINITY_DN31202_c0_g1_i1.p1 TRINITY_DN31202_c0_g1~~TRINITY_DN31202_c0_g1_i1.p1  ORF type:complete len:724 (-),score=329.55 TRINITY_DN31202_c0_g1_i1:273-2444(-)
MTGTESGGKRQAGPSLVSSALRVAAIAVICYVAYNSRLNAVRNYGTVIHEFDPWFNFRATQYLVDNGVTAFLNWFDDQCWYPIGRHVGSTIYPGMMFTAALIYHVQQFLGFGWTLTDVCVYIPAWFACLACLFTYGITLEVSKSPNASVAAAALMAIVPAHMMRSVAGGFDNESVAVTAIVSTFYLWLRATRGEKSWPWAIPAAISYIYMVSAWGAYTFVINMVGLHGFALIATGRFSENVWRSYTIFYLIGTAGAVQFPIVGWQPLQSMEQLMPLGVFGLMQLCAFLGFYQRRLSAREYVALRNLVLIGAVVGGAIVFGLLNQAGLVAPFSNRVRSLFIPHTRTGNPLVDSVAEHQATPNQHYYNYFHLICLLGPVGFVTLFFKRSNAKVFAIVYCLAAAYFSKKMVRLVLLLSPAASVVGGIGLVLILEWSIAQLPFLSSLLSSSSPAQAPTETAAASGSKKAKAAGTGPPPRRKRDDGLKLVYKVVAVALLAGLAYGLREYWRHCQTMAEQLSEPQVIMRGRTQDGKSVLIDDFRQAYWWLRDSTPEDSRVLAWWDYGYQINGIGNRTTLADGNTWNMEHIALIGKALVSPEEEAHKIARRLADYVLVWTTRFAGVYGDDLQKMPHMANIAGSVYPEIRMNQYYSDDKGQPSPALRESLLFRLTYAGKSPAVEPLKHFKEAYTSPNSMVRIYKVLNKAKRLDREVLKESLRSQKNKKQDK